MSDVTHEPAGPARSPAHGQVSAARVAAGLETALYGPVKALLEAQGYDVKGEIVGCDVVAIRGDEPPVIVELKRAFGLELVLQGIDRLALTDSVYLAVGAWPRRTDAIRQLCRRIGVGLIVVEHGRAIPVLDPVPYRPRKHRRRTTRLLAEHQRRVGDPTSGGSVRAPIMAAYRQEALRCAARLEGGPATLREIRAGGDAPRAGPILQTNVYGWFERVERGVYTLSPRGQAALAADRAGVIRGPMTTDAQETT